MIKYVIFDLDGTLLDTSEMWLELGARYIGSLGKTPEEGLSQRLNELSLPEGARYLKERYALPCSPEEISRQLTQMTERFYNEEANFKKGAPELLKELHSRGVRMSIATAGDCKLGMSALTRLGAEDFFAGAAGCSEYGAKTSPEVFFAAARLIGADPAKTLVIEDSLHAVLTARRAGFFTAAVRDIGEPNQDKLRSSAHLYAETLEYFANNITGVLALKTIDNSINL